MLRENGATYETLTWIWSVAVADALYVRAYNGEKSAWCEVAVRLEAGRVIDASITKEVVFEPADGPNNDRIDDAYRAKYNGSPQLRPIVEARACPATLRVIPCEADP